MKFRKLWNMLFLLAMCFLPLQASEASSVASDYEKIVSTLDGYAKETMQQEIDTWVETLLSDQEMGVNDVKVSEVQTAEPFLIYNADKKEQNATVYYPLIAKDTVIGIFSMTKYKGQWNPSITGKSEQTDILNEMDYVNSPVLFYVCATGECGDVVEACNAKQTWKYVSEQGECKTSDKQKKFMQYSFEEKMEQVAKQIVLADDASATEETQKEVAGAATSRPSKDVSGGKNKALPWVAVAVVVLCGVTGIVVRTKKK